jgi:hypothetical protein
MKRSQAQRLQLAPGQLEDGGVLMEHFRLHGFRFGKGDFIRKEIQ